MHLFRDSLVAQTVKNLPAMQETWVQSLSWEDPMEKEMATHSSILACKIPWTEEPGRLQSMGSQSRTQLNDFISFGVNLIWVLGGQGSLTTISVGCPGVMRLIQLVGLVRGLSTSSLIVLYLRRYIFDQSKTAIPYLLHLWSHRFLSIQIFKQNCLKDVSFKKSYAVVKCACSSCICKKKNMGKISHLSSIVHIQ